MATMVENAAGRIARKVRFRPLGYWLVFTVPALMPGSWWLIQSTGSFVWAGFPIVWLYDCSPSPTGGSDATAHRR